VSVQGTRAGSTGVVGSGAPGTISVYLAPNGSWSLVAQISDAAGNSSSSAARQVFEASTTPVVQLTNPPATSGTYYFTASPAALTVSVSNAPLTCQTPGCQLAIQSNTQADCNGTPIDPGCGGSGCSAGFVADPSGNGSASFSATVTDGQSGYLCPQLIVPSLGTTVGASQKYSVDLTTPTAAFTSPASAQLFVGFNQTVSGAIANQLNDTANLKADYGLNVTGKAGSVVTLKADSAAMAAGTGTYALPSDCATACAISISGTFAAAAGGIKSHSITATIAAPSGNSNTASLSIQADISPPADVSPVVTLSQRLAGVIQVSIASPPADDGSTQLSGPAAAYQVRWSASPLDATNWASAGQAIDSSLTIPADVVPAFGAAQVFDVLLPTNQSALYLGVRAVDAAGNLSAFTSAGIPTTLSTETDVPVGNNSALSQATAAPIMRVADIDGDGFDDVVVSYPSETVNGSANTGAIFVFFGSASGLTTTPMKLIGAANGSTPDYPGRTFARNPRFDVGHFAGTSKFDIAAGYFKSDRSEGKVYVWTGASIAAAKGGAAPLPLVISSPPPTSPAPMAIGLLVRNGKQVTGGSAAGDDLLVGMVAPLQTGGGYHYKVAALPRGQFSQWNTILSSAAESFDITIDQLPGNTLLSTFDALPVDVLTGAGDPQSVFVALGSTVVNGVSGNTYQRSFTIAGSQFKAANPVTTNSTDPWIHALSDPASPASPNASFALFSAAGADAVGDSTLDLVVADGSGKKKLYVYDGSTLLGSNPQPAATLDVSGETGATIGQCATFLPDLDGDGKADVAGCIDASFPLYSTHYFFPDGPDLPYLAANPPGWGFTPRRGQRLDGANGFGVLVGAGHISSNAATELVVLVAPNGSANNHVLKLFH
jgi:hypothetical protein